jgi:hypothetical protein
MKPRGGASEPGKGAMVQQPRNPGMRQLPIFAEVHNLQLAPQLPVRSFTDNQSIVSVEDQVRFCREHAGRER